MTQRHFQQTATPADGANGTHFLNTVCKLPEKPL